METNKILKSGEIDISNFVRLLSSKKKNIIITVFSFFLLSLIYILIQTPLYKSTMDFNPSSNDSSNDISSFIDGVVSSYGVNIDNTTTLSFYIPDVIESRTLKEQVILQKYSMLDGTNKTLIQFWEIDQTGFLNKSLGLVKKVVNNNILGHIETTIDDKYLNKAIEELDSRIELTVNDHGKITVDVWMEEPDLANQVNNAIYESIILYSKKIHNEYTEMNVSFVKSRLYEQEFIKNAALKDLTNWLAQNKNFQSSEQLLGEYERLQSEALIEREVYITLKQQYELAEIEAKKNKPPVFELDKPKNTSSKPPFPNIFLIIPFFLCIGFVFSVSRLVYLNEIN